MWFLHYNLKTLIYWYFKDPNFKISTCDHHPDEGLQPKHIGNDFTLSSHVLINAFYDFSTFECHSFLFFYFTNVYFLDFVAS